MENIVKNPNVENLVTAINKAVNGKADLSQGLNEAVKTYL